MPGTKSMLIWRFGVSKYGFNCKINLIIYEFNYLFRNIKSTVLMYYYLVTSKM
jgi:hypothetical protein